MTSDRFTNPPAEAVAEPALLSADAAAAWLGMSRSSLFRLVRSGRLVAVRPFRELRFRVDDLTVFVAELEPAQHANDQASGR